MVNTYKYKNVTWVDLENPTRDEARDLMKKYDLHPLAAEELILPTTRSKVDRYPNFIYLILHFPAWKHSHKDTKQELDVIIGKDFIITGRYDSIDPLHKFSKMFEVNTVLDHNNLVGEHAGYTFYYMMRELYHSLADELEAVKDVLDDIEKKTFTGKEQEMVMEISKMSRELLSFKHSIAMHRDILESFDTAAKAFFGADYAHYIVAIQSEYTKVEKALHSLSEFLTEVRQTNNSLLETKQNRSIMRLTVITIITAVLGIPIAIFEISFKYSPIIGMPNDFWVFSGIILCVGLGMTAILAHKKWL